MAPVGSVPAASPTTYIESGTVASEISGASVAPTIEPVAKMTAEFAPVSACAAARRSTLERTRASPEIPSAAVMSIIGCFHPKAAGYGRGLVDSSYHEGRRKLNQPTRTGERHALSLRPCSIGRTPA